MRYGVGARDRRSCCVDDPSPTCPGPRLMTGCVGRLRRRYPPSPTRRGGSDSPRLTADRAPGRCPTGPWCQDHMRRVVSICGRTADHKVGSLPRCLGSDERDFLGHPLVKEPGRALNVSACTGSSVAGEAMPLGLGSVELHPHQRVQQMRQLAPPAPTPSTSTGTRSRSRPTATSMAPGRPLACQPGGR